MTMFSLIRPFFRSYQNPAKLCAFQLAVPIPVAFGICTGSVSYTSPLTSTLAAWIAAFAGNANKNINAASATAVILLFISLPPF